MALTATIHRGVQCPRLFRHVSVVQTQRPPSTGMSIPVRKLESSLHKNAQALAMSLGVDPRPNGTVAMNVFSISGLPKKRSVLDFQSAAYSNLGVETPTIQFPAQPQDRPTKLKSAHFFSFYCFIVYYAVKPNVVLCVLNSHGLRRVDDRRLGGVVPPLQKGQQILISKFWFNPSDAHVKPGRGRMPAVDAIVTNEPPLPFFCMYGTRTFAE